MKMTRADILQNTNFAAVVSSVVRADDDEVVTRVKGYIGKLFIFLLMCFFIVSTTAFFKYKSIVHVDNVVVV